MLNLRISPTARRTGHLIALIVVAVGTAPTVSLGDGQQFLFDPAQSVAPIAFNEQVPSGQAVVDQTMVEELFRRLEATEAEVAALRNQVVGKHEVFEPDCEQGCCDKPIEEPIIADAARYLIPLSTKCNCGDITWKPGFRIQTRYAYDEFEDNHDFFVRRFRMKAGGSLFGLATYGTELKIDSTSRFGSIPGAVVENAWLQFPFSVIDHETYLRVGLYDAPFSRNALTSDSKLLFMDRTLVKFGLTALGVVDNVVGVLVHGRPYDGKVEYAFGVFDNVFFERFGPVFQVDTDHVQPMGRIVFNLLDPAKPGGYADYQESYVGQGHRLAVGANASHLRDIETPADGFDITAWGVDVFYNSGRWVFGAEYDWFLRDRDSGLADSEGDGWYVQGGYILSCCLELALRHQELDVSDLVGDDRIKQTSIGMNYYIRKHNLKIQSDYNFKDEEGINFIDNDSFQLQLQVDF